MIAFLVRDANGPVGRFLNWRPVVWIGTLSYSIYLGQTLVVGDMAPLWARIQAVMLYACFSYYVIESPFLKLKDRVKAPVQKVEQRAAGV
jgi:peptidoglycan/LPS O-acetylase OafA/YrhL